MPTKRRRRNRNRIEEVSETAWSIMLDREPPADANGFEVLDLRYPTAPAATGRCKELWQSCSDEILEEYTAEFPGSRPSFWWLFSAPRCADDVERFEPRLRLNPDGTPHKDQYPGDYKEHGRPDIDRDEYGIAIESAGPFIYESEASYLDRHGLLSKDEKYWLEPEDYEPETVDVEEEETSEKAVTTSASSWRIKGRK